VFTVFQSEALEAVKSIEVSGVTNMSAGIFTAIDQFKVAFAKRCLLTYLLGTSRAPSSGIVVLQTIVDARRYL